MAVSALEAKQNDAAAKAFDAAEQDFDAVTKAVPRFELLEETLLFRGLADFKRAEAEPAEQSAKHYAAAAAAFDTLLQNYPQSKYLAQVLYTRGDCAYHAGQAAEAARFYRQALAKSPDEKLEPDIMYALGVTQEELKQWVEAGKTYDDYIKKYLSHRYAAEVIMRRGETLFAQGSVPGRRRMAGPRPPGPASIRPTMPRCGKPWPWPNSASTPKRATCWRPSSRSSPIRTRFPVVLTDRPCPGTRADPRQPSGRGVRPGREDHAARRRAREKRRCC